MCKANVFQGNGRGEDLEMEKGWVKSLDKITLGREAREDP